eukprot:TRINITY_DN1363_c1_g1_i1.p1 TRINITY_DN1363_c1_g1~~TRINITY_DN1363_c1_g1_i1.p1  ORF type:complete len:384 (-),score=79.46 TRINITY_DN1363_c1_g1_i1:37-1188(-)
MEAVTIQKKDLYCNKKMLAPLVGGSELSFRLLARKYGAEVTFTEMCVAEHYLEAKKNSKKKLKEYNFQFDPSDRPLILQLAGNKAAPIIELANSPDFVGKIDGLDINCGCPQGFAMSKGIGSGILRTPDLLVSMVAEIVKAVSYPVSVKLRIHEDVPTTIKIMKRLQEVGVSAFTLHGREWWQKGEKRGKNNWDAIREVKENFPDFPIIGNGDVIRYQDFENFKNHSKVDSIMSGYGALLKPSLFSEKEATMEEHISSFLYFSRLHGNKWVDALRHVAWMIKSHPQGAQLKGQLFQTKTKEELLQLLESASPSVKVEILPLPEGEEDKIIYPKTEGELSSREKKRIENRKRKMEGKVDRKKRAKVGEGESKEVNSETTDVSCQ